MINRRFLRPNAANSMQNKKFQRHNAHDLKWSGAFGWLIQSLSPLKGRSSKSVSTDPMCNFKPPPCFIMFPQCGISPGIFFSPAPGIFFPDLFCFPSPASILPLPFHAGCHLQHLGAGTFHFACYLQHWSWTFHVAVCFALTGIQTSNCQQPWIPLALACPASGVCRQCCGGGPTSTWYSAGAWLVWPGGIAQRRCCMFCIEKHSAPPSRNMEKALCIEREALALGTWGNEKDIKFHVACVAEAVAFIHERGVTHRDIKPPNFLLDAQGHCKLAARGCEDWRRPSTDLCRNSTVPCSWNGMGRLL